MSKPLPSEASAVIVGGGIAGLSTAYHLAKQGWKDVVLLERKQLASGTTWHAAGLVRSNIGSATLSKIAMHSQPLFKELEDFTGQATGFKQNGSLGIADNPARFEEHCRAADFAAALGVEAHMVDATEARPPLALLGNGGPSGCALVSDGRAGKPARLRNGAGKRRTPARRSNL